MIESATCIYKYIFLNFVFFLIFSKYFYLIFQSINLIGNRCKPTYLHFVVWYETYERHRETLSSKNV